VVQAGGQPGVEALRRAAHAFAGPGVYAGAERLGRGLIHDSFAARYERDGAGARLVLQRLNTSIFREPRALMDNLLRVTEHLRRRLLASGVSDAERRSLRVVYTRQGAPLYVDPDGAVWRAFHCIEGAGNLEGLASVDQAWQSARAFGAFAAGLADLPPPRLHETLPHFHDLARRAKAFETAARDDRLGRAGASRGLIDALRARTAEIHRELAARDFARLPRRPVHHDCKLDNLLFDRASGEALCVIDLDTVMDGTLLSDFGELVRSSTNRAAEDEPELERVAFDLERFQALASGYLTGVGESIDEHERQLLPLAGRLLTLMNAVRFLTDYLSGDVYFRIERAQHNLERARAQLQLAEHMRARQAEMQECFEQAAATRP